MRCAGWSLLAEAAAVFVVVVALSVPSHPDSRRRGPRRDFTAGVALAIGWIRMLPWELAPETRTNEGIPARSERT
uniref:Uncharacterized protein n=1 Tax=Rhodococcus sp. NS1 TaxID=402236 RepID=A0A097SPX6_9NOCA|nr:hypothetical protein LRS1606.148 [Rhodococcus sp. NS1]